ncbi:NXPE family member 3-like isoform X1 [Xyrichtys novacula]|uniref:NXPE family member 3-like isoform X1 n=1 Tax=Xyrichtys novacula TaxID=13765 RepID=A0AAV1GYT2_XYRNO|nr:NXPE family member 3-like isoform X1 [Xyrichtys novacula]
MSGQRSSFKTRPRVLVLHLKPFRYIPDYRLEKSAIYHLGTQAGTGASKGEPMMRPQDLFGQKVRLNLLKAFAALLLLAVLFLIQQKMDFVEPEVNSAPNFKKAPTHPLLNRDFCTSKPQSAADAVEERLILDSIAWPETPLLPDPFLLEQTSDPAHSTFTILPGEGEWHVGDQLKVLIKVNDFQGHAKKFGGDVLVARLFNKALSAGVVGKVEDHLNGSYSAVFPLLWEGSAQVEVTLVHPSEAVTVLHRLTREQPDRIVFNTLFRSGSLSEKTTCNVCLRQSGQPLCDFTDPCTGEPWFCHKPQTLSCDARVIQEGARFHQKLKDKEETLFQRSVNMKVHIKASGPNDVTVLAPKKGQATAIGGTGKSEPSGYYYQGVWRALGGSRVQQFNTSSAISQCLKGKMVHLYGDSTIRQWFEFLDASLPDAQHCDLKGSKQAGPLMKSDHKKRIMITYRCHGPPLRFSNIQISQMRYIANELDGLIGGSDTVVVIGIWAHFSTFPVEVYIRRLQSIRRAVVHLLKRAPGTLVIIRTANLKDLTLYESLTNSDWFTIQRDKVLRAVFKGLDVKVVDAWEMVLAHHLSHSLHPHPPIIKNMINVLLSYVCPQI